METAPPTDVDPLERLAAALRERTATVAVVGLGYVGLPLLVAAHRAGYPVLGLDADATKIADLREGRPSTIDIAASELASLDPAGFSDDPSVLADADAIVLCLPTPLTDGAPDLSMVRHAAEATAAHLRPGTLVVLESTTWPGTTEEFLRPILETSGLRAGVDFALGYSPERIDPGQSGHQLQHTPKVVSGLTERPFRCSDLVTARSRDGKADREHLQTGQHRSCERTRRDGSRPRRRHLGGAARRGDEAVRVPAVLAGSGRGRPLHRDRPDVPVVARGSAAGLPRRVHRARERGEQPHARVRRDARRRGAEPCRQAGERLVGARPRRGVQAGRR
jgi:hypothetical protein